MEVLLSGNRYVFQWEYVIDEQKTQEFITQHPRISPFKAHRYNAMAICRLKVPVASPVEGQPKLDTLAEGYSFCRKDEKTFSKAVARKLALAHLLKAAGDSTSNELLFTHADRVKIWDTFNVQFPPVKNGSNWEKKYKRAAMSILELQHTLSRAMAKITELNERVDTTLKA